MPIQPAYEDIEGRIKNAIDTQTAIHVKVSTGPTSDLDITMHPYIFGDDFLQFGFVWGYIPFNHVYYKLMIDNIISVKPTKESFKVLNDAVYLFSIEEDHWARVKGLDQVYGQGLVERKYE